MFADGSITLDAPSVITSGNVSVTGAISSATTSLSDAGPTDNLDVSGVNIVFCDTSGNNVTIGGTSGAVAGQVLHIVKTDVNNTLTIEHNEAGQAFYMPTAGDESIGAAYGGWTFVFDGTTWFCSGKTG